jgi:hypothetical protein
VEAVRAALSFQPDQLAQVQGPAFAAWVPSALAVLGPAFIASLAFLVNRLDRRSGISEKFRERVAEGKARIRARKYQPELRSMIGEVARQSQAATAKYPEVANNISDLAIEAVMMESGWDQRITNLNSAIDEENALSRALDAVKSSQTAVVLALAALSVWLLLGLLGVLTSGLWPPQSELLIGVFFGTVFVVGLGRTAYECARAYWAESRLDDRLTEVEGYPTHAAYE